jgi:hypothetical protein
MSRIKMSETKEAAPGVPAFREYAFDRRYFTPGRIVLKGRRLGEMSKVAYKNQETAGLYAVGKHDEAGRV